MKIYADVLIVENTIVNIFLLIVTMKCIRRKYKMLNVLEAGMLGGIYTLVLMLPKIKILNSLPFELLVAFFMIRIVYGKSSVLNILKTVGIFLMITFMLSGLCFLFSIKQNLNVFGCNFTIKKNSIRYIMLGIIIMYLVTNRIIETIKERNFISNYNYLIKFNLQDKEYEFNAFLDTGNELREPVTNLPCILVEKNLISNIEFNDKSLYYIPYNAIGYGGNLKGIRVDNIKIIGKGLETKEIDAIICPCRETLSKENEFNALLSRGVV